MCAAQALSDFVLLDGEIVITAGLPTHQRIQDHVDASKLR